MKLGMVTYMWGAKWDLPTLIKNCETTGFGGVELRTTHAHGVEVALSDAERAEVRKRFDDSPVDCVGMGSACEFHSPDEKVVRENIELVKKFVVLSHDVGGSGVKVRPNRLSENDDRPAVVARIGNALRECGQFAADYGLEIRLEVHGRGTSDPAVVRDIMAIADHPQVGVCWNSNPTDVADGSVKHGFEMLKDRLSSVTHINNLYDPAYPYRELFALLRAANYDGWCLAECPETSDPIRLMHYYKALWQELVVPA